MRNFAVRNFTELSFRSDRGSLFENAIFSELYKNLGVIERIFFWRTQSKSEVDFVLTGDQNVAIEAKLRYDNQLRRPPGLRAFGKAYPDFEHVVATMRQFASNEGICYLPGWMI